MRKMPVLERCHADILVEEFGERRRVYHVYTAVKEETC